MYVSSVTAFLVTYSSSTHLHLDKVELSSTLSIFRGLADPVVVLQGQFRGSLD